MWHSNSSPSPSATSVDYLPTSTQYTILYVSLNRLRFADLSGFCGQQARFQICAQLCSLSGPWSISTFLTLGSSGAGFLLSQNVRLHKMQCTGKHGMGIFAMPGECHKLMQSVQKVRFLLISVVWWFCEWTAQEKVMCCSNMVSLSRS